MLTAAVKDSEEHVRSAACGALGTMGVDPALSAEAKAGIVATLSASARDDKIHEFVRKAAYGALATMGTDQALTPEAKESISATFSAVATNDSDSGALHPRRRMRHWPPPRPPSVDPLNTIRIPSRHTLCPP